MQIAFSFPLRIEPVKDTIVSPIVAYFSAFSAVRGICAKGKHSPASR
jgi:hypothetical protein